MSRTQVRVQQLTGSIIDIAYSGSVSSAKADTAVGNDHLGALLGEIAGSIGRISGRTGTGASAFSNGAAGTFYHTLKSDSTGNVDIGSTTDADKFGDVFLGDGKGLQIGAAEEHKIIDGAPGLLIDTSEVLELNSSGGAISIGNDNDNQNINIGTDGQREITIGDASAANSAGVTIRANTGGIDIDCSQATGDLQLDTAGGAIELGVNAAAGNISIGTNATARTITIGNATGATTLDLDAGSGGVDVDTSGDVAINSSAAKVILSGSSAADSVHIQSELTVDGDITAGASLTLTDDLTVGGNLTVNGTQTVLDTTSLVVEDSVIALSSGSAANADVNAAVIFQRNTADLGGGSDKTNGALMFLQGTGFKLGYTSDTAETAQGSLAVADDDLGDVYVGKLLIDGPNNNIDVVSSNLKVVASGDVVLDPSGGAVLPGGSNADDLGASGTSWQALYLGEGANGTNGIFLDNDADTSIRASADDTIMIEIGNADSIQVSVSNNSQVIEAVDSGNPSIFLMPDEGAAAGILLNGLDSYAAVADDAGNDLLQVTGSAGAPTLVAGGALGSGTTEILTISGSDVAIDNGGSVAKISLKSDNSNFLIFDAPASLGGNVTYTFPAAASDGLFLQTDSAGDLSWVDPLGASLKRSMFKVTQTIAAGTLDFGSSPTTGLTKLASSDDLDLSSLSDADLLKKVEVYVNGALLISGSASGADTDYTHIAADQLSFEFGLETDDIVQIIAR